MMSSKKPVAFVTGATGFLGLNLVRELITRNWEVHALHRPSSDLRYLKDLPLTLVPGDILDTESLLTGIPEDCDALFHVAGDTSLWSGHDARQTRINVEGTRNVVDAALQRGVRRFIHTSTTSAFGRHPGLVNESSPSLAADSVVNYEKSKYLGQELVRKASKERGLDAVILNPAAIIGPFDAQTWARTFYMLRDGKIAALPPGSVSFNHVRNIVDAHINAVDHGRTGEQYILGGETMKLADMLRKMGALLDCKVPGIVAPAALLRLIGQVSSLAARFTHREPNISLETALFMGRSHVYDSSKAQRELGLKTASLDECLRDSIEWLKQEKLL